MTDGARPSAWVYRGSSSRPQPSAQSFRLPPKRSRLEDKEGDDVFWGALQAWGPGTGHRVALPLILL